MDKEINLMENTLETVAMPAQKNDLPLIEEEQPEHRPHANPPVICGECREFLSKMSAQTTRNNRPISPTGWIGVNLLMLVPLVNVLFLFLWACGGTDRTSLKNYARGVLLTVVLLVLVFLVSVVILDFYGMRFVFPDFIKELLQ